MIRKLLHFQISTIVILLIFSSSIYSQQNYFRLTILSNKPFELFLNDYLVTTSLEFDTLLEQGIYKIEAYQITSTPQFSVYKRNIVLDTNIVIHLYDSYPIFIKSIPEDAKVYFDSLYFGSTPLSMNLLFKPKLLELSKTGYKNYMTNVNFENKLELSIELEKNHHSYLNKSSKLKYFAIAASVINGVMAVYTKQVANKYYYKENRTEEDNRKVKIYDKYSGIFTIGMEISFGIFVYLLFQE